MNRTALLSGTLLLCLCACTNSNWINTEQVKYPVENITISRRHVDGLIVGETKQLSAAFSPAEASERAVSWKSSDEYTVSVTESGLIRAEGIGKAYIVVQSQANAKCTDTCYVTVNGSSGIKVYDHLLQEEVEDEVTFIRKTSPARDYTLFVSVHNSYDKSVSVSSSNPDVASIKMKDIDGQTAFTIIPGTVLGTTNIKIQSTANDDVSTSFDVKLETVSVTGIGLSLEQDGSESGTDIIGAVTVGQTKSVRVVFTTSKPGITVPEITDVKIESSDTSIATVDAEGSFDDASQTVSFNVYMVDNPANAPEGKTVITVTSLDGDHKATLTVSAKCPTVSKVCLSETLSAPIHAGDSYLLRATVEPSDAYNSRLLWTSGDPAVATVDQDGLVTVNKDFLFDPDNASATEIKIKVSSEAAPEVYAECTLRPYQYVPASGVLVTDQWGNRLRGTGNKNSKISNANPSEASIQYCAGSGKNKTDNLGDLKGWAVASPNFTGVDKVGSIAVFLTATPYPHTYPTIADPDQPFYWATSSNSRFTIAAEGYEDGSTALGWTGCNNDEGKARLFLGHTCKFFTGHTSSSGDALIVRVFRYEPEKANSSSASKKLLFRGAVHTIYKNNSKYGNPLVKNSDGTVDPVRFLNTDGIPTKFDDPCPARWNGPMPKPGTYWPLGTDGTPTGEKLDWGEIPVPSELHELEK